MCVPVRVRCEAVASYVAWDISWDSAVHLHADTETESQCTVSQSAARVGDNPLALLFDYRVPLSA